MRLSASVIIGVLLTTVVVGYIIALAGNTFAFVIFFPIALSALFILVLLAILFPAANLIWKHIPAKIKNKTPKIWIRVIVLFCFIFLFSICWTVNYYLLSSVFRLINLLVFVGIIFLTASLGWSLIIRRKTVVLSTAAILITLSILAIVVKKYYIIPEITSSERLRSLPYLSYVAEDRNLKKNGVYTYDEDLINRGINIFNFCGIPGAFLIDMQGNILHRWLPEEAHQRLYPNWHHVKMYNNGDLLVIIKDVQFIKLDRNSNIKWAIYMRAHHDIAITEEGDIYVLGREDSTVFRYGLPVPILDDYIAVISPDGKFKEKTSLFKIFKREIPFNRIIQIYGWIINPKNRRTVINLKKMLNLMFVNDTPPDIMHINTIELIDKDINGIAKRGDILTCSYMLDEIGIIDAKEKRLLWTWGKNDLENPHHPVLLDSGNILIFDNGNRRKYSRIVELDPLDERIAWKYQAEPPYSFFAEWGGSNQRLPNGNTLITESTQGRVFQVTKDGKIVWEFYNPLRFTNGNRVTIYQMMQMTNPQDYSFLKKTR